MKKIYLLLFFIFCFLVLGLSLRGIPGNPTNETLNSQRWKDNGPLELSPERGRFALTYSVIEDKSFQFSVPVARFATPDLAISNGKYVSLFAPGVSFLIIPGYLIGKTFGLAQVGSFAIITIFALLNVVLLIKIITNLGIRLWASLIASIVFIFATPAFAYAVSLYQHHITTFLILFAIYVLTRWNNFWSVALIFLLAGVSIPVDYPNIFLMFPIVLVTLTKFVNIDRIRNLRIRVKFIGALAILVGVIPIILFLTFNKFSYGNPLQLSGTLKTVKAIDEEGKPVPIEKLIETPGSGFTKEDITRQKTATGFFKTRNLLRGFYIHLFSPDRGIIVYTPVIFFGLLGVFYAYRGKVKILNLLLAIVAVNWILYSMWGDAYGGWAFGSRYILPFYAVMSILIAIALFHQRKNILFLTFFFLVLSYSVAVNTLGAITSSRNPPKVEAIPLEKLSGVKEKYTYGRNFDYLKNNRSKSFIYQTFAFKYLTVWQYYLLISSSIIILSGLILFPLTRSIRNLR